MTMTTSPCPVPQIQFYWDNSVAVGSPVAMTPVGSSSCSAYGSFTSPNPTAQGSHSIQAYYTTVPPSGSNSPLAATPYNVDAIVMNVNPATAIAGSQIGLSYGYSSTSCPGSTIEWFFGSPGGSSSPLATTTAGGGCNGTANATVPSLPAGTYPVWGLLASSSGPVQGTQIERDFTLTVATSGSRPTSASGGGSGDVSGAAASGEGSGSAPAGATAGTTTPGAATGSGGQTSNLVVFNGAKETSGKNATDTAASGGSSAARAPADISSLDLSGSVSLGRVDPVSGLVDGTGGGLWPVLITLDLLAVLGILTILRRWRRGDARG
jgi:hypothetical protein